MENYGSLYSNKFQQNILSPIVWISPAKVVRRRNHIMYILDLILLTLSTVSFKYDYMRLKNIDLFYSLNLFVFETNITDGIRNQTSRQQ